MARRKKPLVTPVDLLVPFVGTWAIWNEKKRVAEMVLTVTKSGGAIKDHAPRSPGQCAVVGQEVYIDWADRHRDKLQMQTDGSIIFLKLGPDSPSWDSQPTARLQAFRTAWQTKTQKCRQLLLTWASRQKDLPELPRPDLFRRVCGLLENDPDAENAIAYLDLCKEVEGGVQTRIPPERRTIPMTKQQAAQLMGFTRVDEAGRNRRKIKDAVELLSKSMKDGTIKHEKQSRQRYIFDREDFPVEAHPRIAPRA